MRPVTIRYEDTLGFFFAHPFERGIRHLKVAFCNGSQANLNEMAKERIIYRASESEAFSPLTKKHRFFHLVTGLLETAGYLTPLLIGSTLKSTTTIALPFIVSAADKILNKPWYIKGGETLRTHMEEGGKFEDYLDPNSHWRRNPFASENDDPFYENASWRKNQE